MTDADAIVNAVRRGHVATIGALIAWGADIVARDDYAVGSAAANGHTAMMVEALMAAGADVYTSDNNNYHNNWEEDATEATEAEKRKEAMLLRAVDALPHGHKVFVDDENGCVVCLSAFAASDRVVLAPCGHGIHRGCYDGRKNLYKKCYACRAAIAAADVLEIAYSALSPTRPTAPTNLKKSEEKKGHRKTRPWTIARSILFQKKAAARNSADVATL